MSWAEGNINCCGYFWRGPYDRVLENVVTVAL